VIALFPHKSLNRDLYLWLAALATSSHATAASAGGEWLADNCRDTMQLLQRWPGMHKRYQRLLDAHLQQRPEAGALPKAERLQEEVIREALKNPAHYADIRSLSKNSLTGVGKSSGDPGVFALTPNMPPAAKHPPQPVPLWLHPEPPRAGAAVAASSSDPDDAEAPASRKKEDRQQKRRKAERVDMPEGKEGLLAFRLESYFSWAEFVNVDRTTEDDDDDDAQRTADDMDMISVARDNKPTASKVRFDLDLPADQYDDIRLGDGIPLPEWDYKQQLLVKDYCAIQPMLAREAEAIPLPPKLRAQARKLRSQFEMLRPQRHWFSRQQEGTELDLDSYLSHLTDRKLGRFNSDAAVYRECRDSSRDLSCLLLADLSLSTDAYVNDEERVIDTIRNSLFLFSEALSATGDPFALYGFSSRNRDHVRFHLIKNFAESYNEHVRGRINAIKPGFYTRMGAAIRQASKILACQSAAQKILLILTDGKPNDLDKYEGRYGIEDTRMAILEAQQMGLQPFCVTIDTEAKDYLPYLFGSRSWVLVRDAAELPRKLPMLYARLTN
ncbi:MAG: VWA domain-containing protein, partial [Pseudomonadota bacterium]|nr:VWA domain-containing protein [Pseudomonadota bacterium]